MPSSTVSDPTFGQLCAAAIVKQRAAFQSEGRIYRKSDLAACIDKLLPAYLERYPYPAEKAPVVPVKRPRKRSVEGTNIPPTPEEVTAYSASIGYPLNGQAWCDCYAQKGWKIRTASMKNWQAAVRTWKTNRYGEGGIALTPAPTATHQPKNYTSI